MTTVEKIFEFTQSFAPIETAESWDNCGILAGDRNAPVTKVLLSLDITNDVVEEAAKTGVDLIISHHPVIFSPLKSLQNNTPVYNLIKNNISALCLHTNLDLTQDTGVNICLANALGIENYHFIENTFALIGNITEMNIKDFVKLVKEKLDCTGLRFTDIKKTVKTVCVSSGAGGEFAVTAAANGADVFVTGEIKHHEILLANSLNLSIIDTGHFKSEDVVIMPLLKKLAKKFPNILFEKSQTFTDRIIYY